MTRVAYYKRHAKNKRYFRDYYRRNHKRLLRLHRMRYLQRHKHYRRVANKWRHKEKARLKTYDARYYAKNRKRLASVWRRRRKQGRLSLKTLVIRAYGGKCVCCGIKNFEFLQIDHIHGGGTKHRRAHKWGGTSLYVWLKHAGFPKRGFRLLCSNCNFSRGAYGYCPHEKQRSN